MARLSTLWKGVRFGLLLQLAVGPVCLFVLRAAFAKGFWPAMSAVLAVTLTDAAYIALSSLGAAALLAKPVAQRAARLIGGAMLCLFGLDMALGALGFGFIPSISMFSIDASDNLFWQALFITASNPLTILFWGGALTAKVAENKLDRRGLVLFALGCVMATAIFLTAVAALGGTLTALFNTRAVAVLNVLVGLSLVWFGIRLMHHNTDVQRSAKPSGDQTDGVA